MKTILRFAAVAVLVAGSIACTDRGKQTEPATSSEPAVTATETTTTEAVATDTTDTTVTTTETTATETTATQ